MQVDYRNVKKSPADLEEMLGHSMGGREVPLIVHPDGTVETGWEGGT